MSDARSLDRSWYQAIWRWHFLAGLVVMPFLVMMAVTGGLYLFKDELTHLAYPKLIDVQARATPLARPSLVIEKVEAATAGTVLQFSPPEGPDKSERLIVRAPSGEALTAYADPYDGHFLGAVPYGGIMQFVRKIHSLQRFGFWASCLIEITAGWALILVASGLYLWWPRGQAGGVMSIRATPRSRVFWRDLHAVTGIFAGLVIAFLAATGMPWSLFWGVKVQSWVGRHQLYAPAAPAYTQAEEMMAVKQPPAARVVAAELPWSLQRAGAPASSAMPDMPDMPGMPGMEAAPTKSSSDVVPTRPLFGVDRALAEFRRLGLSGSFGLALPIGPKGAYVANYRTSRVEDTRTVYLDQYSGKLLADIRFRDWYAGGQTLTWTTSVHMGLQYGVLNRYLMLSGCVGIILLAISSFTMWWKRRPPGRLGLPAAPSDPRAARIVLGILIAVGVLLPLVGASLLVAVMIELGLRWRPRFGGSTAEPV